LFDNQRLELIEGELINKMGKGRPHSNPLRFLHRWLVGVFGWDFVTREEPIDVAGDDNATNEPEPDLIVSKRHLSQFTGNPGPADLQLVVEISVSTVGFDLTTKAALYARAGIIEYWVLDVAGRRLIVHRDPQAGRYVSVIAYDEQESVAPLAAPDQYLKVGDVLI
jgi:Uma2 family endonuclease